MHIVHDLDDWPKLPVNNFVLKDWFFGATNIAKHRDKIKYVFIGYEIEFVAAGSWS